MKKMFLMVMLLVSTTAFADGDDGDYQYFVACDGELFATDADVDEEELLDLMDWVEEHCDEFKNHG